MFIHLFPQLLAAKRAGQTGHYEIQGEERLGGALVITQTNETSVDVSKCVIQWHRIAVDGSKGGPITGMQEYIDLYFLENFKILHDLGRMVMPIRIDAASEYLLLRDVPASSSSIL